MRTRVSLAVLVFAVTVLSGLAASTAIAAVRQSSGASISTDRSQYRPGDQGQLCYTVPGSGLITITDLPPEGGSNVLYSYIDDGTGGCQPFDVTLPLGRECFHLDYSGSSGSATAETCFDAIPISSDTSVEGRSGALGDTVSLGFNVWISTPGSCLNAHAYPGTAAPVTTCIADGTLEALHAGPRYADGTRWWHVSEGWVDETYLNCCNVPRAPETPSPADVVDYFYGRLVGGNYDGAYALLSRGYQAQTPFDQWASGYATTVGIVTSVTEYDPGSAPAVWVRLVSYDLINGQVVTSHFSGYWTFIFEDGEWKLDSPHILRDS